MSLKKQDPALSSEPLLLSEKDQAKDHNDDTDRDHDYIAITPPEFRHVTEVHSVPAGYQRKRHEYRRYDGKDRHGPALTYIKLNVIEISYLHGMLAKRYRRIMPAGHKVHEQVDIAQIFLAEKAIFVFYQLLRHIYDLLIMHQQFANIAADLVDPR